ncbi:MAG: hypothetical protein Q4D62_06880, partial [Planctomycetia bacterium]|nr:hypothetical protein [Planctomycetia bacterium]
KAAEAKKAEEAKKVNPLANIPEAVALPKPTEGEAVELATLSANNFPLALTLLGGETAIPTKGKKKDAPPTNLFALKETVSEVGKQEWEFSLSTRGEEQKAAVLRQNGNALQFQWEAEIPAKTVLALGNCVLKMECNGKTHWLALREPLTLSTLEMPFKTGKTNIKGGKLSDHPPFPALETMYLEVVRVGTLPKDDKDIELPQPTLLSEISPRNPMLIKFKFTDEAGNVQYPMQLEFSCVVGTSLSGGLGVPKAALAQMKSMSQMILNPNHEIIIANNQKEITATKKKMSEAEGWQRDPKDTDKIRNLQMQNWGFALLKKLAQADVEYRIYQELDGKQFNLVTTSQQVEETPEEKAPKRGRGKKNNDEMEENDMGGMTF